MSRQRIDVMVDALVVGAAAFILAWLAVGSEIPWDFLALFAPVRGWLDGLDPYDEVALTRHVHEVYPGLLAEPLHPFGYPPWYMGLGSWLGLLTPRVGYVVWVTLNALAVGAAVSVLVARWRPIARAALLVATYIFLPALGVIAVGQHTVGVFVGAVALIVACERHLPKLAVVGVAACMFKPHLGVPIALVFAVWILLYTTWWRKFLVGVALVLLVLFAVGTAFDPSWMVDYPSSTWRAFGFGHNQVCTTCSSLTKDLERVTGLSGLAWMALGALALTSAALVTGKHHRVRPNDVAIFGIGGALLVLAYVRSYDLVLAMVPTIALLRRRISAVAVLGAVAGWGIVNLRALALKQSDYSLIWLGVLGVLLAWLAEANPDDSRQGGKRAGPHPSPR